MTSIKLHDEKYILQVHLGEKKEFRLSSQSKQMIVTSNIKINNSGHGLEEEVWHLFIESNMYAIQKKLQGKHPGYVHKNAASILHDQIYPTSIQKLGKFQARDRYKKLLHVQQETLDFCF